ncbi:hypothetical protein BESB_077280 [Besnoitia besnoiti]|uniref:Uncharacterized protein n=1 Tax=Besnoitia besnoiti TaxID=94643 RepID=A0A2A9MB25_BESBE|nr:hypothetical protein BESB_077280 [Besnoitia besnoiti]PFH33511.1 hypothetical protein BESB_077280 [Besnoitia besnoiti]
MEFSKRVTAETRRSGGGAQALSHHCHLDLVGVVKDDQNLNLTFRDEPLEKQNYYEALKERADQLARDKAAETRRLPGWSPVTPTDNSVPKFNRCSDFTCPPEHFYGGVHKDYEELQRLQHRTRGLLPGSDNFMAAAPRTSGTPECRRERLDVYTPPIFERLRGSQGNHCGKAIFPPGTLIAWNVKASNVLSAALTVLSTTDKGTVTLEKATEFFWDLSPGVPCDREYESLVQSAGRALQATASASPARAFNSLKEWYATHGI